MKRGAHDVEVTAIIVLHHQMSVENQVLFTPLKFGLWFLEGTVPQCFMSYTNRFTSCSVITTILPQKYRRRTARRSFLQKRGLSLERLNLRQFSIEFDRLEHFSMKHEIATVCLFICFINNLALVAIKRQYTSSSIHVKNHKDTLLLYQKIATLL